MNTPLHTKYFWFKFPAIFFLSIFYFSGISFSQNAEIEFFPSNEYLSSPSSTASLMMQQDQEGFLWIMGQSLDRYDGNNFVNVKEVEKVWTDYYFNPTKNYLTSDDNLIYQSENHFFFRQIKTGKIDSIDFRQFLSKGEIVDPDFFFYETINGQSYFFFFEPSTNKTTFLLLEHGKLKRKFFKTDISDIENKAHSSIVSDSYGNFFYLSSDKKNFIKIDSNGNLLQKIARPFSSEKIFFIKTSASNSLYVVCQDEIFYLKENAEKFEGHPINQYIAVNTSSMLIFDLLELANGNLWVCGDDRRLFCYDSTTNKVSNYQNDLLKLISHKVALSQIICDQTNVLWIKTQELGLLKVVPQQSLFDNYFKEPECGGFCSFRGMAENEEGKIFACFYHGIFEIDPKTKTTEKLIPHMDEYGPFGLGYDDGYLLLNSGQRYHIASKQMDKTMLGIPGHDSDEGAMVQDSYGNWWNGQEQSIWFFDTKSNIPKWEKKVQIPVEDGITFFLHHGKKSKHIWVANMNKLFFVNSSNFIISKYFETPKGENIYSIFEDENQNIWLGTEGGLVMLEHENKNKKKYTTKDGLPHDFVSGILSEGDSCLWLATNSGLSRFRIQQENFINFYTEHGLTHNEFNRVSAYKAKDGQMFFGGMRGINAFYPQEVMQKYIQKESKGKVVLSSVTRADENLDTVITSLLNLNNKDLEFFHSDKSIMLEFSLTDFRNTNKNQYSYLLEGYDKVWSNPSKYNFASFTSLPPGDYTFRAKAFDAKGFWNPNELAVKVKVYPPWWKTSWAYLIYSLIFSGLFYAAYRLLLYRVELENQVELEQKEGQRLKELDSFKSRLFTNLTHEFRTPLTVILGMTKQVSKGTQELEIDKSIQNRLLSQTELIEKNGQGLLRLVNQLLDLSKLENKAFVLNLKNDDVLPFLNYTVSSFQSFANQQNLAIKFSTNLSKLEMDFDANCLQHVMTNLISNAIKFTHSGGEVFTVVRQVKKSKKHFLQIEIKDTGIGISAEKLPNIFDRFYQVDGSTTRPGEGTGIGLAHSKELVKLMGGEISVKSILNEGTTFIINIPIKNEIQKVENLKEKDLAENKILPPNFIFDGKRIDKVAEKKVFHNAIASTIPKLLLIEDNPDVVTYLKTCLEKDYEIEVAFNGRIGIEKAIQNIPDLIISDVMMPEKDGYEVCDFLKNDERTSHIPIVLLTAKADVDSKIDGLKRGANAYMSKPFDGEELEVGLKMLLENQKRMQMHFSQKEILAPRNNFNDGKITAVQTLEDIKIENVFLQKIESVLEANFADDNFALPLLCKKIGMSRSQLFRKIKALTGESPSKFIRTYRLKKAKSLLLTSELNVSEVARETGFTSLQHFSRVYQEEFGFPPSATCN